MTSFHMGLDIVQAEITRLRIELIRINAEALADGFVDPIEQNEIDILVREIDDLEKEAAEIFRSAKESGLGERPKPDFGVDPIEADPPKQVSFYAEELLQFFGTRLGQWGSRCSQAVLGVRTELNVSVPDSGFSVTNLFDIARIIPATSSYAAVGKAISNLLSAAIADFDVSPGRKFADIGNDLSDFWIGFQGNMTSDTSERRELFKIFVEEFRGNFQGDTVDRNLARRQIEAFAARQTEPRLIARELLLSCMDALEDPVIEGVWFEEDGYETGDVSLHFSFMDGQYRLREAYIDDAPGSLVKALARNFGKSTKCVDLPLAVRVFVFVFYWDWYDDDDDDRSEYLMVDFKAHRRARVAGSMTFEVSEGNAYTFEAKKAMQEAKDSWEKVKPHAQITVGQLSGD